MRRLYVVLAMMLPVAVWGQSGRTLRVGVGGGEPFVMHEAGVRRGIAVDIWKSVAQKSRWKYEWTDYASVPEAMEAVRKGELDVAVGPISITAERAEYALFSQPYYASHLAILSRTEPPSLWTRLRPFFSASFFYAVGTLLGVLGLVGTVIWLAERRNPESHFPQGALHGIGNGIWFAIVTMSTVGYGDMAPKTVLGRVVTGLWIVISVIAATSLIAGIASTLTLTGINSSVITRADQMRGRSVGALGGSPGEDFAAKYGALARGTNSLEEAVGLLERREVDAVVFDRPQMQYLLKSRKVAGVAIAAADYEQQNYGFALPLASTMQHELNLGLLQLKESGEMEGIVEKWLGVK